MRTSNIRTHLTTRGETRQLSVQSGTELIDLFLEPPTEFSPVPIWWWSGERLEPDRLKWQLEQFAEAGVHNVVVFNLAPSGPRYGSLADDPAFFSDDWWRIFRDVCEDAARAGVRVWFYDQLGFSGANFQGKVVAEDDTCRGEEITRHHVDVRGPVTLTAAPGERALAGAAQPIDDSGRTTGPPTPLTLDGNTVTWDGRARHRVMLFTARARGFDYLSPAACSQLFDRVHGEYERRVGEHLGSTIAGSFQDELPAMNSWCRSFPERFQAQCGYDLLPLLAALWEEWGHEAAKVRCDYQRVRASLAEAAFFRPLFDWHERHRLTVGCDQQHPVRGGYPIESVQVYADYLRTHRWFSAPGSDHWGDAKVHSSLAHLYRRPRTWVEAFHSTGWGGTLEETFDWLLPWLRAGATLYNPHAVYYSTCGAWWEWAPPSTCWRQPYWRHYRIFAKTVTRLCAVLSQGHHECDVAVLYPTTTIQAGLRLDAARQLAADPQYGAQYEPAARAHKVFLELVGQMRWTNPTVGVLDRDCRDFDVLDDASLQAAEIGEAVLQIAGERYRALVLPACRVLESATADVVARFAMEGGVVVFVGDLPEHAAGLNDHDEPVRALQALVARGLAAWVASADEVPRALQLLPRRVEAPVPTLLRKSGQTHILFVPAAFPSATVVEGDGWDVSDYSFDPSRYSREMTLTVRDVPATAELWDPGTGARHTLKAGLMPDGSVRVNVPFHGSPCALVVFGGVPTADESFAGESASARAPSPRETDTQLELDGPWDSTLLETLDNRWGDIAKPAFPGSPPVQNWTFQHRQETDAEDGRKLGWQCTGHDDSQWETAHVGFGTRGWLYGPNHANEAPTPLDHDVFSRITTAQATLDGPEWRRAIYSTARGIRKDALHIRALGPKGYVPEEFLDWGEAQTDEIAQFRTFVKCDKAETAFLAVGAAAEKTAWWNGEPVPLLGDGYLAFGQVSIDRGLNLLEFRLARPTPQFTLRAYWALTHDSATFRRPEWLEVEPSPAGSAAEFRRTFDLSGQPQRGQLQVGSFGAVTVLVNGVEVGCQGDFENYEDVVAEPSFINYDIASTVKPGDNTLTIRQRDSPAQIAVFADLRVELPAGEMFSLSSDEDWSATRDGTETAVSLRRRQELDPRFVHLWPRPHPLPEATQPTGEHRAQNLLLAEPVATPGKPAAEWFRCLLPPGAKSMTLPVAGRAQLFVDGAEAGIVDGRANLPTPRGLRRIAAIRIEPTLGRSGGGAWLSPPTFDVGSGSIELGDWREQGLHAWAGGVSYRRTIQLPAWSGSVVLDLGHVRGTAEVHINGRAAGTRIWSPYRFDVTDLIEEGVNDIEIRVFNTLAAYMDAVSPTNGLFPSQLPAGIFGPIRLSLGH